MTQSDQMTLTTLAVLAVASALIATLGVPLWLGKVAPNRFYGFRTPLTVNQQDVWYPVNAAAGRDLTLSGVISAMMVVLLAAAVPEPDVRLMLGVWLTPILLGVVHSFYAASVIAAERLEEPAITDKEETAQPQRRRGRERQSE